MTKKQGAGTSAEHYVQDAAEIYLTAKLQEEAENLGVSISNSSQNIYEEWADYCEDRNVMYQFLNSKYRENVDSCYSKIVNDLVGKYQNRKFDFKCVDVEYRNLNKKGDLIITFDSGEEISVSVKNYKNGFDSIQVCSGTFNSTLNNFIFDNTDCSPGMYIDPVTGKKFKGSTISKRDALVSVFYPYLTKYFNRLDEINKEVRDFYLNSDEAKYWDNIASKWKSDCESVGQKVCSLIVEALSLLPQDLILKRMQKSTGLVSDEHLLCLGNGDYLFSLTNSNYQTLCQRVKNATSVNLYSKGQSVFYDICDSNGVIISINQPCTLQKNGAWFAVNEERFDGLREKNDKGKKVFLAWGERRPMKSRELATSTNTYLRLKEQVLG